MGLFHGFNLAVIIYRRNLSKGALVFLRVLIGECFLADLEQKTCYHQYCAKHVDEVKCGLNLYGLNTGCKPGYSLVSQGFQY